MKLEIFEGPLDLLLHLIRKNEVDIYDIPIALITHQYLEYLDMMREMNIGMAGEFLVMASTLAHIKSRMLLPASQNEEGDEEGDDPRVDLVAQLKEHMKLRAAAERLESMPRLGRDVFLREGGGNEVEGALAENSEGEIISAGLFDLIAAFHRVLKAKDAQMSLALPASGVSLEERMTQLIELLKSEMKVDFEELFAADRSRGQLIVTFLALLELLRLGLARSFQARLSGSPEVNGSRSRMWVMYQEPETDEE